MIIREPDHVRVLRDERAVWTLSIAVAVLGVVLALLTWPWGDDESIGRRAPLIGGIILLVVITVVTYLRTRHVVEIRANRVGVGDARRDLTWFRRDQLRQVTVRGRMIVKITLHDLDGRRVLHRGLAFHRAGELREVLTEADFPLR